MADSISLFVTAMNYEKLEAVHEYFRKYGNKNEEISENQFLDCFHSILGNKCLPDNEMSCMFRKIDCESIGRIPWNDFSTYLLQQSAVISIGSEIQDSLYHSVDENLISEKKISTSSFHKDFISDFVFMKESNTYLSSGLDGLIKAWEGSLLGNVTSTINHTKVLKSFMKIEKSDVLAEVRSAEIEMIDRELSGRKLIPERNKIPGLKLNKASKKASNSSTEGTAHELEQNGENRRGTMGRTYSKILDTAENTRKEKPTSVFDALYSEFVTTFQEKDNNNPNNPKDKSPEKSNSQIKANTQRPATSLGIGGSSATGTKQHRPQTPSSPLMTPSPAAAASASSDTTELIAQTLRIKEALLEEEREDENAAKHHPSTSKFHELLLTSRADITTHNPVAQRMREQLAEDGEREKEKRLTFRSLVPFSQRYQSELSPAVLTRRMSGYSSSARGGSGTNNGSIAENEEYYESFRDYDEEAAGDEESEEHYYRDEYRDGKDFSFGAFDETFMQSPYKTSRPHSQPGSSRMTEAHSPFATSRAMTRPQSSLSSYRSYNTSPLYQQEQQQQQPQQNIPPLSFPGSFSSPSHNQSPSHSAGTIHSLSTTERQKPLTGKGGAREERYLDNIEMLNPFTLGEAISARIPSSQSPWKELTVQRVSPKKPHTSAVQRRMDSLIEEMKPKEMRRAWEPQEGRKERVRECIKIFRHDMADANDDDANDGADDYLLTEANALQALEDEKDRKMAEDMGRFPKLAPPQFVDVKRCLSERDHFLLQRERRRRGWRMQPSHVVQIVEKEKPVWVVAMCVLPDSGWVVVCTSDRRATFFEPAGMRARGQLVGLEAIPSGGCIGISAKQTAINRELLVLGRDDGNVEVFAVTEEQMKKVIDVTVEKGRVILDEIVGLPPKIREDLREGMTQSEIEEKIQAAAAISALSKLPQTPNTSTTPALTPRTAQPLPPSNVDSTPSAALLCVRSPQPTSRTLPPPQRETPQAIHVASPRHATPNAENSHSTTFITATEETEQPQQSISPTPPFSPANISQSSLSPLIQSTSFQLASINLPQKPFTQLTPHTSSEHTSLQNFTSLDLQHAPDADSPTGHMRLEQLTDISPSTEAFHCALTKVPSPLAASSDSGDSAKEHSDEKQQQQQLPRHNSSTFIPAPHTPSHQSSLISPPLTSRSANVTEEPVLSVRSRVPILFPASSSSSLLANRFPSARSHRTPRDGSFWLSRDSDDFSRGDDDDEYIDEELRSQMPLFTERMRNTTPLRRSITPVSQLFWKPEETAKTSLFGPGSDGSEALSETPLASAALFAGDLGASFIAYPFASDATRRSTNKETSPDATSANPHVRNSVSSTVSAHGTVESPNHKKSLFSSPTKKKHTDKVSAKQPRKSKPKLPSNLCSFSTSEDILSSDPNVTTARLIRKKSVLKPADEEDFRITMTSSHGGMLVVDSTGSTIGAVGAAPSAVASPLAQLKRQVMLKRSFIEARSNPSPLAPTPPLQKQKMIKALEEFKARRALQKQVDAQNKLQFQGTPQNRLQLTQRSHSSIAAPTSKTLQRSSPLSTNRANADDILLTPSGTTRSLTTKTASLQQLTHKTGLTPSAIEKMRKKKEEALLLDPSNPNENTFSVPKLSELNVFAQNNFEIIERTLKTAFQHTLPTPSVTSDLQMRAAEGSFSAKVHRSPITAIEWIPDLSLLLTASLDATMKLLEIEKMKERLVMVAHTRGVRCVVWSAKYKIIVSGGLDHNVIVWNSLSATPAGILTGHTDPVISVTVDEHSDIILSLSNSASIRLWDVKSHAALQELRGIDPLTQLPFKHMRYCPHHKVVVLSSARLVAWRHSTKDEEASKAAHNEDVQILLFNREFSQLVSIDLSNVVNVWDTLTGRNVVRFRAAHKDSITTACFDKSERRLLTASTDGLVKVWNHHRGLLLKSFEISSVDTEKINRKDGANERGVCGLGALLAKELSEAHNDEWDDEGVVSLTAEQKKRDKETGGIHQRKLNRKRKRREMQRLIDQKNRTMNDDIFSTDVFPADEDEVFNKEYIQQQQEQVQKEKMKEDERFSEEIFSKGYKRMINIRQIIFCSTVLSPRMVIAVGSHKTIRAISELPVQEEKQAIDGSANVNHTERIILSEKMKKHGETVLCCCFLSPNIVVTGADDGSLIAWNADTGVERCTIERGEKEEELRNSAEAFLTSQQKVGGINSNGAKTLSGESGGGIARSDFPSAPSSSETVQRGTLQDNTNLNPLSPLTQPANQSSFQQLPGYARNTLLQKNSSSSSTCSLLPQSSAMTQQVSPTTMISPAQSMQQLPDAFSNVESVKMNFRVASIVLSVPQQPEMVLTHSADGFLRIYAVLRNKLLCSIQTHIDVGFCAFDRDGLFFALSSLDGLVQVYRTETLLASAIAALDRLKGNKHTKSNSLMSIPSLGIRNVGSDFSAIGVDLQTDSSQKDLLENTNTSSMIALAPAILPKSKLLNDPSGALSLTTSSSSGTVSSPYPSASPQISRSPSSSRLSVIETSDPAILDGHELLQYQWKTGYEETTTLTFIDIPNLPSANPTSQSLESDPMPNDKDFASKKDISLDTVSLAHDASSKNEASEPALLPIQNSSTFLAIAAGKGIALFSLEGALLGSYGAALVKGQLPLQTVLEHVPIIPLEAPAPIQIHQKNERKYVHRRQLKKESTHSKPGSWILGSTFGSLRDGVIEHMDTSTALSTLLPGNESGRHDGVVGDTMQRVGSAKEGLAKDVSKQDLKPEIALRDNPEIQKEPQKETQKKNQEDKAHATLPIQIANSRYQNESRQCSPFNSRRPSITADILLNRRGTITASNPPTPFSTSRPSSATLKQSVNESASKNSLHLDDDNTKDSMASYPSVSTSKIMGLSSSSYQAHSSHQLAANTAIGATNTKTGQKDEQNSKRAKMPSGVAILSGKGTLAEQISQLQRSKIGRPGSSLMDKTPYKRIGKYGI